MRCVPSLMMSKKMIAVDVLRAALSRSSEWELEGECIVRGWEFEGFGEAMAFVNAVADVAELANHHPDILIRYNKVKLMLSTHELGGVTEADLEMAGRIDRLCAD